jgi:GGDEF domain-containing protein
MMPQSSLDSAVQMAERVRQFIRKETFHVGPITVSIGISQVEDELNTAIAQAEENLRLASQGNGNKVVAGKQQGDQDSASGLETYFKE